MNRINQVFIRDYEIRILPYNKLIFLKISCIFYLLLLY